MKLNYYIIKTNIKIKPVIIIMQINTLGLFLSVIKNDININKISKR